jgi:hypothetical protein
MAITATINTTTSGPNAVSVTVPSATSLSKTLSSLTDIDLSVLSEGSILQYNATNSKWKSTNDLLTENGRLLLNGGTF